MAAGAQVEGEHREHFWVVLDYEHSIVHSRHPTFTVKSKGVAEGIRIVPVLVPARDREGPDPQRPLGLSDNNGALAVAAEYNWPPEACRKYHTLGTSYALIDGTGSLSG